MSKVRDLINSYFTDYYTKHKVDFDSRDGVDNYTDAIMESVPNSFVQADVEKVTHTASNKDYRALLGEDKYAAIESKAKAWGKSADAIAGIIWHESKGKVGAINPYSKASGIIQFMPSTAKGLGTTVEDIRKMDFNQQLDLTEKYFSGFGKRWDKAQTATDLYALVFYPEMASKEGDFVLGASKGDDFAAKVAKQNKIFDLNKDNKITKDEFYEWGALKMALGGKFTD
ncbi:MAG: transglycosylase SLT domain-containing protein [Chlamydiia bacterium]|nr:transglycosylase SLT domain-containing protein [Chlamydiia bacterium]